MGISADKPEVMERFAQEEGGPFPMVGDPEGELIRLYDVMRESGKAERSTYVIGQDGLILRTYEEVKAQGHAAKVLADLQGF